MTKALTQADETFLASPRLGILITTTRAGRPLGVPVWFDWTGRQVLMFTVAGAPKLARLARQAFASMLVTNHVGEPEHWIAFDGPVAVSEHGGIELAERLAGRYWNLEAPERAAELERWRDNGQAFRLLTLTPQAIRTGS